MIQAATYPIPETTNSGNTIPEATIPEPAQPAGVSDPFDRIIGQRRAVPFLKEIRDGICLGSHPHPLLLLGRSGHGKSSLSRAFADSVGADFVSIACGPELRSEHLVEKLLSLKTLAIVFCDELQSLRKKTQEILYSAIDSSVVPALDHGRLDRCSPPVQIPAFILIGATNEPGRLLPALRSRMVNVVMDDYSDDDLRAIVIQKSKRFLMKLSDRSVGLVVRASGGSPRSIVQILQAVEVTSASWRFNYEMEMYDLANQLANSASETDAADMGSASELLPADILPDFTGEPLSPPEASASETGHPRLHAPSPQAGSPSIPDEIVERALMWMGLDLAGLDATGRTILTTVAKHGRATAELIATVLGFDIGFSRHALSQLRSRSLLHASPGRGWVLTDSGEQLVKELSLNT